MQTQTIDARSTCNDFNEHLREVGVIGAYPESYAKDHDYQHYGFDFIETEEDIEKFLSELDKAPTWHGMGDGSCKKAYRIRNVLSKPDDYNWGKLKRFKIHAASARRTCCGCHETGSYQPNEVELDVIFNDVSMIEQVGTAVNGVYDGE